MKFTESTAEDAALEILGELGYAVKNGPDIGPDGSTPERMNYSEVVLVQRLKTAIAKFNPKIQTEGQEEALKKILRSESPGFLANNHRFHQYLTEGVDVQFRNNNGAVVSDKVWLFDL